LIEKKIGLVVIGNLLGVGFRETAQLVLFRRDDLIGELGRGKAHKSQRSFVRIPIKLCLDLVLTDRCRRSNQLEHLCRRHPSAQLRLILGFGSLIVVVQHGLVTLGVELLVALEVWIFVNEFAHFCIGGDDPLAFSLLRKQLGAHHLVEHLARQAELPG